MFDPTYDIIFEEDKIEYNTKNAEIAKKSNANIDTNTQQNLSPDENDTEALENFIEIIKNDIPGEHSQNNNSIMDDNPSEEHIRHDYNLRRKNRLDYRKIQNAKR